MAPDKLNIAYFSNQFAAPEGHGITKYSRELWEELNRIDTVNVTPVAAWSGFKSSDLREFSSKTGLKLVPSGRKLTPLSWTFFDFPKIERMLPGAFDLVHAVSLGYPIATRKPYVVTIHDLGPLTHPEYFTNTKPWIMKRSLSQACDRADALICVSQTTANELCEYVGGSIAERVRVVHEGVSEKYFLPANFDCLKTLKLPNENIPIVLSAGKISPRKNVQGVLMAMALVASEIPHHLVLVGGTGWETDEVFSLIDDSRLRSRVHILDYVSDEQLGALYQRASLFIYPSHYEGFGLTVLEAMASGTPVLTSNKSSLPEVAGDAAFLTDPSDIESISDAIVRICLDPTMSQKMVRAGINRAKTFRWSECAKRVAEIYETVAY